MHLIVGLGNPTKQYEGTRHNVGFETIDRIAAENQIRVEEKKHKALYGSGYIEGEKVILAKPQTFMNLSGESVRELADYYKIPSENIIVIYDDISEKLKTQLGTKVNIVPKEDGSGKIEIEFYSHDELDRILDLMK